MGKILVLIPTRNRSELAKNAIRSVLEQKADNYEIVVSDNSTDDDERATLKEFCSQTKGGKVSYIIPPTPLSMIDHWGWAVEEAVKQTNCTYLTILTDRMLFKPNFIKKLSAIIDNYPEKIVSYTLDLVGDANVPVTLFQLFWTGNLYEVESNHLVEFLAKKGGDPASVPKLMNSCCPISSIKKALPIYHECKYNINPDYTFAYILLSVTDTVLYYDYPLLISYGLNKSNGVAFVNGDTENKSYIDFLNTNRKSLKQSFFEKYPLTASSSVNSDYFQIRQVLDNKLPELNENAVIRSSLGLSLFYENRSEKRKIFEKLLENFGLKVWLLYYQAFYQRYKNRILNKIKLEWFPKNAFEKTKKFATSEEAIQYAVEYPRHKSDRNIYFKDKVGEAAKLLGNY